MNTFIATISWLSILLLSLAQLQGQQDEKFVGINSADISVEYLEYKIPKTAIRKGLYSVWGEHNESEYRYTNPQTKKIVAKERVLIHKNQMTTILKRELFLNELRHGFQHEWHNNGQLKSMIPFKRGIMHGECKHYDKNGKLVGWYHIQNGAGTRQTYHSNGKLKEIEDYFENRIHGRLFEFRNSGRLFSFSLMKNGSFIGSSGSFHKNGTLRRFGSFDNQNRAVGPFISFYEKNGKPSPRFDNGKFFPSLHFYYQDRIVSQKFYKKKWKENPLLLPVLATPEDYKQMALKMFQPVLDEYKNHQTVKIPLQKPTDSIKTEMIFKKYQDIIQSRRAGSRLPSSLSNE